MTTLRVVVDQILAPVPGGIGRYTSELTRALVATAPRGCDVQGVVAAHPQAEYDRLTDLVPGLSGLAKSPLGRRELAVAWQTGLVGLPGKGMVHATSLLAPLGRHDRDLDPERVHPTDSSTFVRPAPRPSYSVLGHDAWRRAGLEPMRPWQDALAEASASGVLGDAVGGR